MSVGCNFHSDKPLSTIVQAYSDFVAFTVVGEGNSVTFYIRKMEDALTLNGVVSDLMKQVSNLKEG